MASSVVVMGVSGCGKSSLASALAHALDWRYIEGDAHHSEANLAKMKQGVALTDADRDGWLGVLAAELQRPPLPALLTCSALKRAYRDQLRRHAPQTEFLHLYGTPEVIGRRQASRPGHFMPASLLQSQFDTLEPLDADEGGLVIDVDQAVDSIVDDYVSRTGQEN